VHHLSLRLFITSIEVNSKEWVSSHLVLRRGLLIFETNFAGGDLGYFVAGNYFLSLLVAIKTPAYRNLLLFSIVAQELILRRSNCLRATKHLLEGSCFGLGCL
jgi:hypothetical protein